MFKVGLNVTSFGNRYSGAKNRFINIYIKLINKMKDVNFYLIEPKDYSFKKYFTNAPNVNLIKTNINSESRIDKFFSYSFFNHILKSYKFNIYENFSYPFIKNNFGVTLSTIHDLRYLNKTKISNIFDQLLFKFIFNGILKSNDYIITVSNFVKKELSNYYPEEKIKVIYNVKTNIINKEFHEKEFLFKAFYNKKFILTVGHLEKRKNYLNLLKGFCLFNKKNNEYDLVIIGQDNGELSQINKKIKEINLKDKVHIFSDVSNQDLNKIYKLCSLFVFPSVYEGFGIPIIEALQNNAKICLSDIEIFREITQNKAKYFNPLDPESIAIALDERLKENIDENISLGYFDSETNIIKLEKLYRKILSH